MTGTNLVRRATPTVGTITPIPAMPEGSFADLLAMGAELVRTGFLPEHVKNGAQAAAIILAGRELGMQPMRALRSLVMVKGKVTESADSQLARFKTDGGKAVFTTLDDTQAVLVLRHPNGDEHTETFTIEDARKAGLLSSGMYSKFPKAMLRSRAITAGLKSVGWEGGSGVYDPGELLAAPEPAQAAMADAEVTEVQDDPAPTDKQRAFLANLLKSHVFSDDERARVTSRVTTRERMTKALEWAQQEIAHRKASETDEERDADQD